MGSMRNWRGMGVVLALVAMQAVRGMGQEGGQCPCPPTEPPGFHSLATAMNIPECPDQVLDIRPPRMPWYGQAEVLILTRDAGHDLDVASRGAFGNVVLSTRDLDFPFNAGPSILIGHTINECYQIEGGYFNLSQWDDTAAIRDPNNTLFSPFTGITRPAGGLTGIDRNDFVSIHETSFLRSAELNLRQQLPMPPGRMTASFLVGLRYIGISERLNYLATSPFPAAGTTTTVNVDIGNDMLGPQIGGKVQFFKEACWWIDFEAKGAILQDSIVRDASGTFTAPPAGIPASFVSRDSERRTAFLGDLDLTATYRVSPFCSARFGYRAIWVDRVALASDNFQTDISLLTLGPAHATNRDHVVYHGPHAGLEFNW